MRRKLERDNCTTAPESKSHTHWIFKAAVVGVLWLALPESRRQMGRQALHRAVVEQDAGKASQAALGAPRGRHLAKEGDGDRGKEGGKVGTQALVQGLFGVGALGGQGDDRGNAFKERTRFIGYGTKGPTHQSGMGILRGGGDA